MSSSTQIQKQMKDRNTLKKWIQSDDFKNAIGKALPAQIMRPDTLIRIALTATMRTPKLLDCTKESLFQCLLDLAAMGLAPDGTHAHLIPYGNKCTLIVDYKGFVRLLMRSGEVSHIHAEAVCENDEFEYSMGEVTKHKINFKEKRGKPYAYYSVVRMKDGTSSYEVMTMEEIYAIRDNSAGYKRDKSNSPWTNFEGEMCKKTVFRRHRKWLPISFELQNKMEGMEQDDLNHMKQVNPDFIPEPSEDLLKDLDEQEDPGKKQPAKKAGTKSSSSKSEKKRPPKGKEKEKPVNDAPEANTQTQEEPEPETEKSVDDVLDDVTSDKKSEEKNTSNPEKVEDLEAEVVEDIPIKEVRRDIIRGLKAEGIDGPELFRWLKANKLAGENAVSLADVTEKDIRNLHMRMKEMISKILATRTADADDVNF